MFENKSVEDDGSSRAKSDSFDHTQSLSSQRVGTDVPQIIRPSPALEDELSAVTSPASVKPSLRIEFVSLKQLLKLDDVRALKVIDDYYKVLESNFPDPDQVPYIDELVSLLDNHPTWDMSAVLLDGRVVAGLDGQIFSAAGRKWAVIEHIFVDSACRAPEFRFGSKLYEDFLANAKVCGCAALLAEVEDPFLLPSGSSKAAIVDKRAEWWGKRGHLVMDVPYIQPALVGKVNEVSNAMMTLFPLDNSLSSLTGQEYLDILHVYFSSFLDRPVKSDPSFIRLTGLLTPDQHIDFLGLDTRRSFINEAP